MEQNKYAQTVFIFENTGDLLNKLDSATEIQKQLHTKASNMGHLGLEQVPSYRFFQIKKCVTKSKEEDMITLQFIDIDPNVFYDDIKAQEGFSTLINSTISHEMRNPLNAIISQELIHQQILDRFTSWLESVAPSLTQDNILEFEGILDDYKEDSQVLKTSS